MVPEERHPMHIDLSADETTVLGEVLEAKLRDLRHELHHTRDREFKQALRARHDLLEGVLTKLGITPLTSV